jgi:hypothetical protein
VEYRFMDGDSRTGSKQIASWSQGQVESMRDQTLAQMRFARDYTLQLIEAIPGELWTAQPSGTTTHLAWQVGHLAVSQYGLMLFRQRGRGEGDLELMPGWLRKKYGRGTQPPEPSQCESSEALLEMLGRIDEAAHREATRWDWRQFLEPTDMPFAAWPIKLGAFLFCPLHESIHAGQIGLLRRLLGLEPVR